MSLPKLCNNKFKSLLLINGQLLVSHCICSNTNSSLFAQWCLCYLYTITKFIHNEVTFPFPVLMCYSYFHCLLILLVTFITEFKGKFYLLIIHLQIYSFISMGFVSIVLAFVLAMLGLAFMFNFVFVWALF